MARFILFVVVLLAGFLTATVSVAFADVASPARLTMGKRRALIPPHRHASALRATHSSRDGKAALSSPSTSRRNSHRAVAVRRKSGSGGGVRGRHARVTREAGSTAPQTEAVSLHQNRIVPSSALKGSFESLARQNEMADSEGLERIQDEEDLADRIVQKLLVPVPASSALSVNGNLPEKHKYCRPWTANFLADLARAHAERFGHPIEVSSAVRTVEYQKQLKRTNGNAAAAEGDVVSPHLTGATVDVAKRGMSGAELSWMRGWLLALQRAGTIDVEEEFRQQCFHISVYKNYVTPVTAPADKPRPRRAAPRTQLASRDL